MQDSSCIENPPPPPLSYPAKADLHLSFPHMLSEIIISLSIQAVFQLIPLTDWKIHMYIWVLEERMSI